MTRRKAQPKGDTTAYVRMQRMRRRRKAEGWQPYEVWLDPSHAALLTELKQPGESLNALIARALQNLQAQNLQAQNAQGMTWSPVQRKAALLARMRTMKAQGLTYDEIATQLNAEHEPTVSGRGTWHGRTVQKQLDEEPRPGA